MNIAEFYAEYFTVWFDLKKFDWDYSEYLAMFCSSDFEKWWNQNKFDWKYSDYLIKYCSSDILTWFDKSKIDIWDLAPCSIVLLKKHGKL